MAGIELIINHFKQFSFMWHNINYLINKTKYFQRKKCYVDYLQTCKITPIGISAKRHLNLLCYVCCMVCCGIHHTLYCVCKCTILRYIQVAIYLHFHHYFTNAIYSVPHPSIYSISLTLEYCLNINVYIFDVPYQRLMTCLLLWTRNILLMLPAARPFILKYIHRDIGLHMRAL